MPNVTGPDFITLHVRDLEASQRFYAEVLGLPLPRSIALRAKHYDDRSSSCSAIGQGDS